MALCQGNYGRAAALLEESLGLVRSLGDKRGIAECLEALASVAAHTGHSERAARLLGTAQALREAIGAPIAPADYASYERTLAVARARLDEDAFSAAWAAGRAMAQVEPDGGGMPVEELGGVRPQ